RREGTKAWIPANIGDVLCQGDELEARSDGQVTWRTPDGAEHRLQHELGSRVAFAAPEEEKSFLHDLKKGLMFVLSRDSREIGVRTRFANGGPEGTEFVVFVDDNGAAFETLDGAVLVSSTAGAQRVAAGERLRVGPDGVMGPPDAAGPELLPWAYYPRIVAGPLPLPDAAPANAGDADFFVRRAAARLAVGAVV